MRAAPAVVVHLPGSRRWDVACVALGAASPAALVAAVCRHFEPDAIVAGLYIAVAAVVGALLLWFVRPRGTGRLRWDGAHWWYRAPEGNAPEQGGSVMVMMDWGRWMLLRFDSQEGVRRHRRVWLPVSDLRVPGVGALRIAAYGCGRVEP